MKYRCAHCKRVINRDSRKAWIKSYCVRMERYVRLQRVR